MNISHLPEEIIINIIKYLNGKDLISISQTNSSFDRILCDKQCVSNLDFSKAYTCSTDDIKNFFTPRARCLNVFALDISTAYWLKPHFIIKLKNIQSLQMLAVPLTFLQLESILKSCLKLQEFSLNWPEDKMPLTEWREKLLQIDKECGTIGNLLSLQVLMDSRYVFFKEFLGSCKELRKLIITNHHSRRCNNIGEFLVNEAEARINLVHLEELAVDRLNSPPGFIWDIMRTSEQIPKVWRTCWDNGTVYYENLECINNNIIGNCSKLLFYLKYNSLNSFEILGTLKHLKELMIVGCAPFNISLTNIVGLCPNLTSLNVLSGLNVTLDIIRVNRLLPNIEKLSLHCQPEQGPPKIIGGVANFYNLTHLTVPVCALIEVQEDKSNSVERNDRVIGFKRMRVGASTKSYDIDSAAFNEVFNNCSKLVMLQIGFTLDTSCSPMKVNWECLVNMKKLKNLTHITLDGIPISNGNFLIEIAKGCNKLEFLRLRHLGPSGKCVYVAPLAEALPFCKNLIHFRFEQSNVDRGSLIFKALEKCEKLERLAYLCERDNITMDTRAIDHLIETRTNLIFVFIVSRSITKEKCAKLTKKYRNIKSRPALVVRVRNVVQDVFEDANKEVHSTPACHFNEMITFRSWMYEAYNKY